MIYGIGTDIVKVNRIQASVQRWGEAFAQRILHESELVHYQKAASPANFLAKRFAAKEAAVKALGTGFSDGIRLREISVGHEPAGRPVLLFYGKTQQRIEQAGIISSHISISDEQDYVIAFVVMEKRA